MPPPNAKRLPINPVGSWSEYFDSTRDLPLHPIYRQLEPHLAETGNALELGCGVGTGARWLAARGYDVWAIDALLDIAKVAPATGVRFERAFMEDLAFEPGSFDLVVAGFCLFFLGEDDFLETWPRLMSAIRPGGLFCGQFLGPNDDWAGDYLAHDRAELDHLFRGFDFLLRDEVERDGKTSQGTEKHWHVTHVIARKEGPTS